LRNAAERQEREMFVFDEQQNRALEWIDKTIGDYDEIVGAKLHASEIKAALESGRRTATITTTTFQTPHRQRASSCGDVWHS
jgi:hypothetical protein